VVEDVVDTIPIIRRDRNPRRHTNYRMCHAQS
jgi:hypothetical protein